MSDLAKQIMRDVLNRAPTAEDYRQLNQLLDALPAEILKSPAAMYEIVGRMNFLQQLEATIQKAGRHAQQQIHHDLPIRVDQAALIAVNKIRDTLPRDAAASARRLYKFATMGTLAIAIVTCSAGWVLGANHVKAKQAATHAASDREFGRCIDASTAAYATSARRGVRPAPVTSDTVRNDLMICAAEYADRRAGNH
ncbi:hypothetical protein GGR90_001671 [Sphingopyxis italica]|uniref:Uncharacterized protein n=1 Tax=Sphingopyxis italica TaxID=1129133 RepID=A0A7X5XSJ6_9SPHN|nr:hypothetical protein [Sphingopyxis italica]NJB89496.1 hypothetical protein [Sphingopyxis italica]